jgi:hypothetical protein
MPARDYSVTPEFRWQEQISDISARRRLRYQDQTDVDPAPRLPASPASDKPADRSKPAVSNF